MAQSPKRILASMRHQHCDCVLEVRPCGADESVAPTRIAAHRAILARAAYFGALFRQVEPDRVDRRDDSGARVCRSVYILQMPFDPAALAFVVDCLYDDEHVYGVIDCADPVDTIHAALFVEAPPYHVRCLVRIVVKALLTGIATKTRNGNNADGARAHLASFLWHMLASGLDPTVKTRLLGRTLGLVSETERATILTKHADLAPAHFYHPPSRVGDAIMSDDGRRWRLVHLVFDDIEFVGGKKRVEWDGMVFSGFMGPTSYGDNGVRVHIERAPNAARVGGDKGDVLRAVSVTDARGYDITESVSLGPFWAPCGGGTEAGSLCEQQRAAYAASGRTLPRGALIMPDVACSDGNQLHDLVASTQRVRRTVGIDLEAYEIVLLVEELGRQERPT
ncbi:BTB domain containing protein [Pandoravirus macleodensis]|uniref:BTB domain containing protein n=1 Tax=Pandoravirus macleodensis TaxID=2107707 RepID=A0A2U7UFP9_9VIRU|nr:BTB domain containing protein [Pandoravirus macleodensis]AVK77284.1 BTB domain containing protein [Pandoravirus macleodensis]UMO80029.1 BTB domain containing protein [Pandoravirus aubagnensis]